MTTLLEDTRQKADKHENKHRHFTDVHAEVIRCALPFGDYAMPPKAVVDTKQGIAEIAYNMCGSAKEKTRFRNECIKAREAGCKLIFLIEDCSYKSVNDLYNKSIFIHNGQTIKGDQLATAMHVMTERYGCEYLFCRPEDAGRRIMELLEQYDGK